MSSTVFVNSVTLSQAAWFQDVDNVAYQFLSGVAGTNTITATGPAGLGAYAAGLKFRFIPAAANTGATTINITGTAALGARNIFSGGAALSGGELVVGIPCEITDDGTQFNITSSPFYKRGVWTPSVGGTATYAVQLGDYVRLGNLVYIRATIAITLIGTGSTTTVSGLPFAAANIGNTPIYASVTSSLASAVVSLSPAITGNTSTFQILSRLAANAADSVNAIFGNGAIVTVSGSYLI